MEASLEQLVNYAHHTHTINWVYFAHAPPFLTQSKTRPSQPYSWESVLATQQLQGGLASINVCLGRVAPVSALEDLPEQEETKVDWDLMMKLV
jgi:hypothetical protein